MQKLNKIFEDSYVLCLCEGGAEISIMNMLVNSNKLIFNEKDLIQKKVHPRMNVRKIESKFLNKRYSKPLVILRIIDSSREQFNLKKQYRGRFSKVKCLTKPEIEILVIIDKDELEEFYKVKSKQKASTFCKSHLNFKNIKDKKFMDEYFDIDRLIEALRVHKHKSKNNHYTIYDLIDNV